MKAKRISPKELRIRINALKLLVLDMDGVMTDGTVFYVENSGWTASYSVFDGFGIRRLLRKGVEVAFISGGTFISHKKRAELLGVKHAYFGSEDKVPSFEKILKDLRVKPSEAAYMGDELFDIPVLRLAGVAACPPHSPPEVKRECVLVTKRQGGYGAVREICDLIYKVKFGEE